MELDENGILKDKNKKSYNISIFTYFMKEGIRYFNNWIN